MKSYVVLAVLAALCMGAVNQVNGAAISYDDNNNPDDTINFGAALKMYYLALQHIMPCGYAPYNIPVLAPFTLDFYDIDLANENYSLLGNVSDLLITGLNNFRILGGTYNTTTNRTSYDMIFPEIQMLGEYSINAMANFAGYRTEMSGSGLLNIKMIDYRVTGEFVLIPSPQNPKGLSITNFNLNFYIGDVIFNNWNNLWNISMNNFVNKIAREFMLMWTQEMQVQVNDLYAQYWLPSINSILDEVSMTNLINFFVSQAKIFNNAVCPVA